MSMTGAPSRQAVLGAAWLGGLMAIHPLPHTGALRSLLVLVGIVQVAFLFWRQKPRPWHTLARARLEGALLALLTLWLIVPAALLSVAPTSSLTELGHEWGKLLGFVALGVGLVASLDSERKKETVTALTTGMFLGAFVHVPLILGYHAWQALASRPLPLGEGPLGNYGYVSLPVNAALAFLLGDAAERLCHRRRLLPLSDGGALLAVAAVLVANALLTAKAGLVMTHLLGWAFLAAVLRLGTPHRRFAIAAVIAALTLATLAGVMVENRWGGAADAIASGMAKAEPPPAGSTPSTSPAIAPAPTPSSSPARALLQPAAGTDPSFYIRSFSAKAGLRGIAEHPFGLGYGADAFGRLMARTHGASGLVSSESGWIDFALANGLPGLLLLLGLAAILMRRGWLAFRDGNVAGLALSLFVLNFVGRSALDGYLAGSRLTVFALMTATLLALVARPAKERHAGHAD